MYWLQPHYVYNIFADIFMFYYKIQCRVHLPVTETGSPFISQQKFMVEFSQMIKLKQSGSFFVSVVKWKYHDDL